MKYSQTTDNQEGRAYAFFDCKASKEQIEAELPLIRECVRTPNSLELSLIENPDKKLRAIVKSATSGANFGTELKECSAKLRNKTGDQKDFSRYVRLTQRVALGNKRGIGNRSGVRYVLEAKYTNATNKQTADEVADIMSQAYQSPLYADGEEFRGDIVYQDGGRYVFRD